MTRKMIAKLEAAERAAGIEPPGPSPGLRQYGVGGMGARVQEEPVEHSLAGLPPDIRQAAEAIVHEVCARVVPRLDALEAGLRRLEEALRGSER